MKKHAFLWMVLLGTMLSCSDDEKKESKIDPADVDRLTSALEVQGKLKNGAPPVPTFTPTTPEITNSQSSASVTNNNNLYVPFTVESSNGFSGVYVQLFDAAGEPADAYWQIPLTGGAGTGQVVVPLGIPGNVLPGEFSIYYCLYTSNGEVSSPETLDVEIVEAQNSCETGSLYEEGEDGLTIRSYTFETSGTLAIDYEMYSAQDRMDVFVDQVWVAGTGSRLSSGQTPPASICGDGADGFVSGSDYIEFNYTKGDRVDIYLSGCFGGTAWYYNLYCPE